MISTCSISPYIQIINVIFIFIVLAFEFRIQGALVIRENALGISWVLQSNLSAYKWGPRASRVAVCRTIAELSVQFGLE